MIKELIKPILTERIRICNELQDNWGDGIEKCWKKEIEILTNNLTETVHYFSTECSDEDFYWISEVFEELISITQYKEFISIWNTRLSYIKSDNYKTENFKTLYIKNELNYEIFIEQIKKEIEYAEDYLDE